MAKLPESFIDNLLSRIDLVEIIGTRVALKKQGKDYSARCPFHDDHRPSLRVRIENGAATARRTVRIVVRPKAHGGGF